MYSLIVANNHKRKINIFKILGLIILCALIIFLILFSHISKNNNKSIMETSSSTNEQLDNNITINNGSKISSTKILRNEFLRQSAIIKDSKHSNTLSDVQYNNIINIYSNGSEKTVYLTFDDGPSKNITPLILDLLKQENIKATFFLLGMNVEYYPEIAQREYLEGHYLANHGYSHRYSEIYESKETILNDYNQCEQALKKALGNPNFSTRVYRFPGGSTGGRYHDIKASGKELLKENNVAYLDWNALTFDAEGTPTHESILENLEKTVGNKDVVVLLMHDSSSKILTYETLPEVITFFKERGYCFKTLYDIL